VLLQLGSLLWGIAMAALGFLVFGFSPAAIATTVVFCGLSVMLWFLASRTLVSSICLTTNGVLVRIGVKAPRLIPYAGISRAVVVRNQFAVKLVLRRRIFRRRVFDVFHSRGQARQFADAVNERIARLTPAEYRKPDTSTGAA
jgi:hypothetical protein